MAQNVTIAGASYSAVPSIEVPKTGGGTAVFVDTTIGSNAASASDITSGKYAWVNGTLLEGIGSGGGGITVTETPDSHGGTIIEITAEEVNLQSKTNINPTTSSQTIEPDTGYTGLSSVQINAMPTGTAGTPTATKGSVSNHSISVTPSVTNTTGYITGSTKTGAAVTVSASELVSGTLTVDSSGTKDVTNYASASVAAGTAGTPSATKGTVSNHSVTVTPSVTNSTGWISGSTKTGTAVTVSASELVSGSETKTANGTYDVTNLAQLVVNVSGGGGGLVYETGTYTPTSDIARPEISFSNTHSETPVFVGFSDSTGTANTTTNTGMSFLYFDIEKLFGYGIPYSSSAWRYVLYGMVYRGTSSSSLTNSLSSLSNKSSSSGTGSAYPSYYCTNTGFHPYGGSTSRYFRSGRTYKWFAVWKPTT